MTPTTVTPPPPDLLDVDAGVIEEARRRQRRQRIAGAALVSAVAAGVVALSLSGGAHRARPPSPGPAAPLRLSASPTWLTGTPLAGVTHLRLVVSEGPPYFVDVDSGSVRALHALGVPTGPAAVGPVLDSLMLIPGGALAVVNHQACAHCALTEDDFLIGADGSVRRVAMRHFPALRGTIERERVPGTTAEWVLTWPHAGTCTLRLVPSTHAALKVPCGELGAASANGVTLWTHNGQRPILVNPLTGTVTRRLNPADTADPVGHGYAIEGTPASYPTSFSLVNLATGTRHNLGWPSTLPHFGYRFLPAPHGPLVAVAFGTPAYKSDRGHSSIDASDIWLLNTRTATFTQLPGFPILDYLKQSGIAWTADGRLIMVAQGGGRTTIGVWRPGQRTISVRTVPALDGYSDFAPLVR